MGRLMRARLAALSAVAAIVLGLLPAPVAAASWVEFGTPTVESSFDTGLHFSQPVIVSRSTARVELLVTQADAIGPDVIEVPFPPFAGASTLTHDLSRADGFMLPNTRVTARWRLTPVDGPADVVLGPEVSITFDDDRFDWKTEAGDLVRVHWIQGSAAFGRRALRIAEDAVRDTSSLLGVTETEPIDFFIYAEEGDFRDAIGPGVRENVGGLAVAEIRTLFALIPESQIDDAWVGVVIPHELTHLVFDTASRNPYHEPPHWLNEGVAVYVSEGYAPSYRSAAGDAAKAGDLIPLEGLVGQFPTGANRFYLGYAESVSAVDYLVRTYGTDALVTLIRSYADGRTDDEAFKAALGVDAAAFGAAWLADAKGKAPTRYGPQPAPSGPVPADWQGAGGTGGLPAASPRTAGAPAATLGASLPAGAPGIDDRGAAGVPAWVPALALAVGIVAVIVLLVAIRTARRPGPGVGG
jgi:hypothetical protein